MPPVQNNESLPEPRERLDVAEMAVVTPTQTMHRLVYEELRSLFPRNTKTQPFKKKLLADSIPLLTCSKMSLLGPVLGAPAAVLGCESLIHSGVSSLILVGTAGGLLPTNDSLNVGDIVFPRSSLGEDGTSCLYGAEPKQDFFVSDLQSRLEESVRQKLVSHNKDSQSHLGSVWTTDAPLQESKSKVEKFSAAGAFAVDMELSALLRLCTLRKTTIACVLVISDLLGDTWEPGFGRLKKSGILGLVANAVVETVYTP